MAEGEKPGRQYVWDVPTRLFHWLLVGLIGFSWWSAENDHMDWHTLSGLGVCGLLAFRILWGIFGTGTARFVQFVKGPRAALAYLREGRESVGHNPLGGWSVIALLLVLATQVTTGVLAVDIDGIESGPLSYLVDFDTGRAASSIHQISFTILQILVALHVAAILFYLVARRRNLTAAMITGFQKLNAAAPVQVARARWWQLLLAVGAAALLTWWLAGGARF
jgi:cytochrome b